VELGGGAGPGTQEGGEESVQVQGAGGDTGQRAVAQLLGQLGEGQRVAGGGGEWAG
jgi:hypothetical protein